MNATGQTPTPGQGPINTGVAFPDRRSPDVIAQPVIERRQFSNTHSELSDEARQLGLAIDQYKLVHRRRFVTYEEMLGVIKSLGYRLDDQS